MAASPKPSRDATFGVSGETAVSCQDLVIRYGDHAAVDGLSLSAGRGEVLVVLGPNGAGKTSTLEALEGYRRPDEGAVRVLGHDPVADRRRVVERSGVMLQQGGLYPMLGPRRALDLFSSYYGNPRGADELLSLLDLEAVAGTPWRRLSGGEQRRLSLALALVGRPEVAFLDEPTAGVDPEGRLAIRQVIEDLRDGGACVLVTTHELAEAEVLADRVVIVDHGRALAEGTPAELAARSTRALRFRAAGSFDLSALGAAMHALVEEGPPGSYRVAVEPTPEAVATLTAWLAEQGAALSELRTASSLEEIYLGLVREPAKASEPLPTTAPRRRRR